MQGPSQPGPSHPSGLITGRCLSGAFSHLRLFCMILFMLLGLCLCCCFYLEFPFLLIFYLVKLLISSRSRSHASPFVKTSLHIYYTFLWNFSSQVWLYTFPVCSIMHALMRKSLVIHLCSHLRYLIKCLMTEVLTELCIQ